jgi:hypothetical protein
MSELDRIRERVRQNRTLRRQTLADTSAAAASITSAPAAAGAIGSRVFDLVTGEEGEVIGGHTENIIVPAAGRQNG